MILPGRRLYSCAFKNLISRRRYQIMMEVISDESVKRRKIEPLQAIPVLYEVDAGIEQYMSAGLTKFDCVVKARYTDFIIHEIDETGKIVKLQNLNVDASKLQKSEENRQDEEEKNQLRDKLSSLIGPHLLKQLDELSCSRSGRSSKKLRADATEEELLQQNEKNKEQEDKSSQNVAPEMILLPAFEDKSQRTELHNMIAKLYKKRIATYTADDKQIKAYYFASSDQAKNRRDNDFRALGGEYCYFTLYKEGRDTSEILSTISKRIKISSKLLDIAGMKDKRGCSSQRVSVFRTRMERIIGLNKLRNTGFKVGDFEYKAEPLKLGKLKGNRFLITLRKVEGNVKDIEANLQAVQRYGFINYFGLQRFGTNFVPTHFIGKCILLNDYKTAIMSILSPKNLFSESDSSRESRELFDRTGDAAGALELMPGRFVVERAILELLARQPNNFLGAYQAIPKNIRIMYLHAYQSFVWNKVVSYRMKKYGCKVIPGDIVLEREEEAAVEGSDIADNDADHVANEPPGTEQDLGRQVGARILSEEDVHRYTIFDIVMPFPGSDIVYPTNELFTLYKTVMGSDGLDPDSMIRAQIQLTLRGSYRYIAQKAENMSWRFVKYSGEEEQLSVTDLDEINNTPPQINDEGPKLALQLEFDLGTAAYATMLLREVIREDTGPLVQCQKMTENVEDKLQS